MPVANHSFGGWKRSLFGDLSAYGPTNLQSKQRRVAGYLPFALLKASQSRPTLPCRRARSTVGIQDEAPLQSPLHF